MRPRARDDRRVGGLVTRFGAWGAGVNGGGWLRIDAHHVDLLYRDLRRVRAVIEQCVRGEIDAVYLALIVAAEGDIELHTATQ